MNKSPFAVEKFAVLCYNVYDITVRGENMKIIEANIIQFGKFKDKQFTFDNGFNVVKGDNESGKSTLLGFIKFVLYGVGRKNPSVIVGERERALSWNVGIAAGSLTVEDENGKKYRIERSGREGARGSYVDKVRIIDLENGEEVFAGEVPGERFLGINAQAYDSMCNIKQLETVSVGGDAIKGVIDNLLSSGDESTDIQAALKTLDTERRRLMHTNNKGGLVYDSEIALERLKSEHRGAVVLENERIKNADELARVEAALLKAREEHGLAQRMCDLHDDVLRLEKFDKLRALKQDEVDIIKKTKNLEATAEFDKNIATYEKIAEIKNACDSVSKSENALQITKIELENAEKAFSELGEVNSKGFVDILDEFGSARSAITHLAAKKKKKNNSALTLTILGVGCAIMLVFAAVLIFAMQNVAGAMTVGFIGVALGVGTALMFSKFNSAKAEIYAFMSKLGEGFCPNDEDGIFEALNSFSENRNARTSCANSLENARFRCAIAQDNLDSDKEKLTNLARALGIDNANSQEKLLALADKIKAYIESHANLDNELREKKALIRALENELERFSEKDISARITPQIRERIKEIPFEKLKAERDSALQKTNQFSQYKAGIERNLAAHGERRSADDIFPEIEAEQERLGGLKLRLDAVRLAMDTINKASANLKSDITPRIRENAQKNLSLVTSGKYNELFIDESMSLSIFADGATRPIDSLSKGSLDAAYFSVRLALLQTLLYEKNPPLYMDESLSQLDDGRAENVVRAIVAHSKNAQCILFTCQNRDVAISQKISDVNIIEL